MADDVIVNYNPPPTGEDFMASDALVRLIMGPVGSGKSTVCIEEIARRCFEMPKCKDGYRRSRWVIIRNTVDQLKTTTLNSWKQWFPPGVAGTWREQEKTFLLNIGDVRAEIMFRPLDTPEDTKRLLSLELTGAFINETREVAPEIIQAVISRLGRYPSKAMIAEKYWYGLIMDTNPPSRDSWLYETFEEKKPTGWEIFKQPGGLEAGAENRENLPDTYYEDMMNGATEDWIDVHVHGQYGRSLIGRPVFEKTFKRSFHVVSSALQPIHSDNYTITIGLDLGRTPAAVIGQRDWASRVNIIDAVYVENIGLENFVRMHLKPRLRQLAPNGKYVVIIDPAGTARSQLSEKNALDILKAEGLRAVPASTNDISKRLQAVESLLSQQADGGPMLRFPPDSTSAGVKHLITGMDGGYRYKRMKNGGYEASPEKNSFSHLADALQYFCLGVGLEGGYSVSQRREIVAAPYKWL